jgi:type II secretory pathway pseudopilin PulG
VTLIELLVVMAILSALALLALMLLPSIGNTDAALKGTEEVRAQCKIAQALAAGSRQPRGVRFLIPPGGRFATELQLIEAPPITVFDATTLSVPASAISANDPTGLAYLTGRPRVDILYELYNGTEPSIDPAQPNVTPTRGAIKVRHCYLVNLSAEVQTQVAPGGMLVLPTLGFWARINSVIPPVPPATNTVEVVLDVYPDSLLGASNAFRTYHAGVYGPPVPLLGQATIPLPEKIGVDFDVSTPQAPLDPAVPAPARGYLNYDMLFAPDGQTISVAGRSSNAGVYLWVRDVTKATNPAGPLTTTMRRLDYPLTPAGDAAWADAFRRGGEQHAVGISNGYVGTAPIQWPPAGTLNGQYPVGTGDPFTFARKRLN